MSDSYKATDKYLRNVSPKRRQPECCIHEISFLKNHSHKANKKQLDAARKTKVCIKQFLSVDCSMKKVLKSVDRHLMIM